MLRLGRRIHAIRMEQNLSLEALAQGAEFLGTGYLSSVERGLCSPTLNTLGKTAQTLKLDLVDLVNDPELSTRHRLIEITRHLGPEAIDLLCQHAEQLLAKKGNSGK
jgi:transcriptional regulator with XRE-family HTH domain